MMSKYDKNKKEFDKFMHSNMNDKINYDKYCQKLYGDIIKNNYEYAPINIEQRYINFKDHVIEDVPLKENEWNPKGKKYIEHRKSLNEEIILLRDIVERQLINSGQDSAYHKLVFS